MIPLTAHTRAMTGLLGAPEGFAWWVTREDRYEDGTRRSEGFGSAHGGSGPLVLAAGFEYTHEIAFDAAVRCRRGWEAALSA